jgi:hypothetical protein
MLPRQYSSINLFFEISGFELSNLPWHAGATNLATHLPYLATNLPPYFLIICVFIFAKFWN